MTDPQFPKSQMPDLYRSVGRPITGDSYIDGFDIDNPGHFIRAIEEVKAAGGELPAVLEQERERLRAERERARDLQAARPLLLAELARVRQAARLNAARAERARTVTFPSTPEAADDWLVIGSAADTADPEDWNPVEIDGVRYRFHPNRELHFMPAEVALAWPLRRRFGREQSRGESIPGDVFEAMPRDLLRIFRSRFSSVKTSGRQGTGPGYSEVDVDESGLLAKASSVVRACFYPPLLRRWLETAKAAGDDVNSVLASVIEERLGELEAEDEEAEEDESSPDDSDEDTDGEESAA